MLAARHRLCRHIGLALGLSGVLGLPCPARAEDSRPAPPEAPRYAIHIAHDATAGTLRRVLDGARDRLGNARCQRVLDRFWDTEGRSLRDRLAEIGHPLDSYLGLLIFYDGRRHPRCAAGGVIAVTQVGSRVVHVCPRQLDTWSRRNARWTEATVIHEALHTLGLGENPPSSQEITSTVLRQCH